jgi:hypothetical protein
VQARRSVWANPRVRELLAYFVPVADEVSRLQRGDDADGVFFQGFAEFGHYAGRVEPSPTRQGMYAIAPSGRLLGSINTRSADSMATMLADALDAWSDLSADERHLSEAQHSALAHVSRWRDAFPEDGLVLDETARDLEPADGETAGSWNLDHVWFTADEARALVPDDPTAVGAAPEPVPDALAQRLARFHLLDTVHGQTTAFPAASVERAELTTQVEAVDGDRVEIVLRGATRCENSGTWAIRGYGEKSPQRRGVSTRLFGRATWDLDRQRFVAFELIASGERWGGTQFNVREQELEPSPIGFVFELAPEDGPRVAPAFIYRYGWRR